MSLVLLCISLFLVAANAAPLPEAIRYIGVGYNVIRGNPDGDFWARGGDDPGMLATRKILKLSDDSASVPNQVIYEHHDTCRKAHEFVFFHDPQSYQAQLMERITASGTNNDALTNVAFTLSSGYKAIEQQTRRDFYVFQDDQDLCISGSARYKMSLSQGNHYGVSDEFAAAACSLPIVYNGSQDAYKAFIDTWGTHVTSSVEVGSKVIKRYIAPVKDYVEFVMQNSSRDVTVGGAYMNHASSLNVDINAFKYRTQYRTIIGNLVDTLSLGSETTPEPIGMSLVVISDMLEMSHWQNVQDYMTRGLCPHSAEAVLARVRVNLEQALKDYPAAVGASAPAASPVAIPITWPEGTYSLPKPQSGCPAGDFTWYEGWRLQDTETQSPDNAWSTDLHLDGSVAKGEFTLKYCTKGERKPTVFDRSWPKGDYCIFKYGDCPADFAEGYVKWDDEDDLNRNDWQGVLPDGVYNEDTLQRFCCRSDGMPTEAVVLPSDSPFYLFQYKRDMCQKVANMQVNEEWLRWDDEDFLTPSKSELGAVHPGMEFWNEATGASGSEIYYCHYTPQTK